MDIEQLKLIIEAISSAGDGAFKFAVLWLCKDLILSLLSKALILFMVIVIYRTIRYLIHIINGVERIQDAAGWNTGTTFNYTQIADVVELIKKGKKSLKV